MTKYVFFKNIICDDSAVCIKQIMGKLELSLGGKLHVDTDVELQKGHISVSHEQGNHKIWVFLYDTDNEHESEMKAVTVIQPSDRVRRWDLAKPPVDDLITALD